MKRDWLIEMRLKKNLTQSQVSSKLGITQQSYSIIESGRMGVRPNIAIELGKLFGFKWTRFYE